MGNKEKQKKRMLTYFLEATNKIIEEEGIEAVTIRKVADIAGYNSATIYNYFENLNHILFFASLKCLKSYADDLHNYTQNSKNSIDAYLNVWRCFCYHSYSNPQAYNIIFFSGYSHSTVNDSIKVYYSIFPEDLSEYSKDFLPMLLEDNIYARDYKLLSLAVSEGLLREEDLHEINEMNVLIYQSILSRMLNKNNTYTLNEAIEKTLKYITQTLKSYKIDNLNL